VQKLIKHLKSEFGYDFSNYRSSVIDHGVEERCNALRLRAEDYFDYLRNHPEEIHFLLNVLTIHYTSFFRNPLVFSYIESVLLPKIIQDKSKANDNNLRIWCAGCASGAEAFSLAMLVKEYSDLHSSPIQLNLFATDIDPGTMLKGESAVFHQQEIENVRYGFLKKYFSMRENEFLLSNEIKSMVNFSVHDLLGKTSKFPSESIYGDFDLVLCRNVLIYYSEDHQNEILKKLSQSITNSGFIVLGEAEMPTLRFRNSLRRENTFSRIYQVRNGFDNEG